MKLNVRKIAQGPVLAKGETDCGKVTLMKKSSLGCSTDMGGNNETLTYGGNHRNGGTVGAQYSGNCSC